MPSQVDVFIAKQESGTYINVYNGRLRKPVWESLDPRSMGCGYGYGSDMGVDYG